MLLWQPMPLVVWDMGQAAPLVWAVFALGWVLIFTASFLIDPLELFGLKQAFTGQVERVPFKTPWLYQRVRHPIMLGSLLAVWAAPVMTQGRFLLAVGMTAYIALALPFEERDLRSAYGVAYEDYARRVPALIPRLFLTHGRTT
jgi:protein-S-isoprenylcysteine O-methyltransferase Ste14